MSEQPLYAVSFTFEAAKVLVNCWHCWFIIQRLI